MHYISTHSAAEFAKFVTRERKDVELGNVVKTLQLGLLFSTVTFKRGTFNDNKTHVYYMMVEIVVVKHIFTKATAQFHSFLLATKLHT